MSTVQYSVNWNSDFHPVGMSMHQAFTIEVFFNGRGIHVHTNTVLSFLGKGLFIMNIKGTIDK